MATPADHLKRAANRETEIRNAVREAAGDTPQTPEPPPPPDVLKERESGD